MPNQLTKKDIKQIVEKSIEGFAKIVAKGFSSLEDKIVGVKTELEDKIVGVKTELEDKILGVKTELEDKINQTVDGNDKIIKELKDMRAENAASLGARDRLYAKIKDHESRIIKLEKSIKIKKPAPVLKK